MKNRTRIPAGGVVAVALLAGGLFGGVFAESPAAGPSATVSPPVVSESALSGITTAGTESTIAHLEAQLASVPGDPDTLATLGLAYQVRWRETGDASYLPRSDAALGAALAARRDDPAATLGLGNLALIQHEFAKALVVGRKAQKLAPYSARPYGVIGDAQIELGLYEEGFKSFERMVSVKPNLASYARISYARELSGDTVGAIAAMQLALDASGGQAESTAWVEVELGKLEFGRGRVDAADRHFRAALAIVPGYVYALDQRARVEAARGRVERAVALAREASETIPLPQFVGLLGDLLQRQDAAGRRSVSRRRLRPSTVCSPLAAFVSISSPPSIAPIISSRSSRTWSSRGGRERIAHPSTATTPSAGPSPAPAGATRRSRGRSDRSGSARATRSSGSTAGTRQAAPGTRPA